MRPHGSTYWSISLGTLLILSGIAGCQVASSSNSQPSPFPTMPNATASPSANLLAQSWDVYRKRFIQADGRVIDWEGESRSTSEGQAYAMLRAVLMGDRTTFDLTLRWGENNLKRQSGSQRLDTLWAWKWGKKIGATTPAAQTTAAPAQWGILDQNFASDADIDAATALILAARRWHQPAYLRLAQAKLKDIWEASTLAGQNSGPNSGQNSDSDVIKEIGQNPDQNPDQTHRYLLPGPKAAFQKGNVIYLNPSYLAPAAFRLFAQVDPQRDWLSLVDSSYAVLRQSAQLSAVKLPSDWVALDLQSGRYQALGAGAGISNPTAVNLVSRYSFDAYRVWWRVSWDATWFQAPAAKAFLQEYLLPLQAMWRSQQSIPAQLDLQGKPLVTYESTAQYAMLYAAWQVIDPAIAAQLYQTKLLPRYQSGIWDDPTAYYTQNLAGLGLLPPTIATSLLLPSHPVP